MAESAQPNRTRRWRAVTTMTVLIAVLATTAALAATVTQRPTISGYASQSGATLTATDRSVDSGERDRRVHLAALRRGRVELHGHHGRLRPRVHRSARPMRATGCASASRSPSPVARRRPPTRTRLRSVVPDPYRPNVGESDTCTHVTPTGPGKGTFSSGTQTGGGSEPTPGTTLSFIKPFPVIRIAGRFKGTRTTLTRVTVRTPRGTRVRIRCSGHGCAFKRKAVAAKLISLRSLRRTYRPKATIEIRVTKAKKIGKYTRVRTRRGKAPVRIDRCLMPGKTKPVRCPAG